MKVKTLNLGRRQMLAVTAGLLSTSAANAMTIDLPDRSLPVGFLPAGTNGPLRDAALVQPDDLIMKTARVTVSGHLQGSVEQACLDVFFGADGRFPFHAWESNRNTGSSDGNAIDFVVPFKLTGGLKLRLNLEGRIHELVIDETWSGPRLRQGSYVIAIDKRGRTPAWSRIRAQKPSELDLDLSAPLPHILVSVEAI